MRAVRCLLATLFVLTSLAGCLGDEPAPPPAEEPAPLNPYVHKALPNVTRDLPPTGPGIVRYVASENPDEMRLVGFNLSADRADWNGSAETWYSTGLDIVPFGDVTEWAFFLFGASDQYEVFSLTNDETVYFEAPVFAGNESDAVGARIVLTESSIPPLTAVAAIKGDGGLAIGFEPTAKRKTPPLPLDTLLQRPGGEPAIIGNGTGMAHAAYYEKMSASLAMRYMVGNISVEDRVPADTRPLSPLMDITLTAPPGPAGWADIVARYSAGTARGEWSGTVTSGQEQTFGGTVSFAATNKFIEEYPWFAGQGDTNATTSATYTILSMTDGVAELLRFHQTTFGTPMATLLGTDAPFVASAHGGGEEEAPGFEVIGNDLVLLDPGRTTVYVDAIA